jgi:cytochrome c556
VANPRIGAAVSPLAEEGGPEKAGPVLRASADTLVIWVPGLGLTQPLSETDMARLFMRALLVSAVLIAGAGAVLAQADPIKERNELMRTLWREGLRPVALMNRGEAPFDRDVVERSFSNMTEIAGKLPPLWPPNSVPKDPTARYYSSPKIWENKADFDARLAKLASVIAENRPLAVKDLAGAKSAFEAINQTCDGCHERYQARNR